MGLILGPIFESRLRHPLAISQGGPVTLIQSPVAATIYVALPVVLALSIMLKRRPKQFEVMVAAHTDADIAAAVQEVRHRGSEPVVIDTTRAGRLVNPAYAEDADVSRLETTLDATGVRYPVRHSISEATTAEEAADAADEAGAGLIVIGLRHRTPAGKLIMGFPAQAIVLSHELSPLTPASGFSPSPVRPPSPPGTWIPRTRTRQPRASACAWSAPWPR
jgi:nucleotide-binding universal stress UspA family protein